jgi:hypothetical protein
MAIKARIDDALSRMSLAEKLGTLSHRRTVESSTAHLHRSMSAAVTRPPVLARRAEHGDARHPIARPERLRLVDGGHVGRGVGQVRRLPDDEVRLPDHARHGQGSVALSLCKTLQRSLIHFVLYH